MNYVTCRFSVNPVTQKKVPNNSFIPDGCILLARKLQYSDIWKKPADWLKIWIYILQEVNHSDGKQFPRGSNFFNVKDVARECGVSHHSIYKFLKWAKSATLVATRKTTRGVVVSVVNYAKYQTLDNYKSDTRGDMGSETEAKQKRHYKQERKNVSTNGNTELNTVNPSHEFGAQNAPTPAEYAQKFFSKDPDAWKSEGEYFIGKGVPIEFARAEFIKFANYWTELTPGGRKQKWETNKTFEVRRRLVTWFTFAFEKEQKKGGSLSMPDLRS